MRLGPGVHRRCQTMEAARGDAHQCGPHHGQLCLPQQDANEPAAPSELALLVLLLHLLFSSGRTRLADNLFSAQSNLSDLQRSTGGRPELYEAEDIVSDQVLADECK